MRDDLDSSRISATSTGACARAVQCRWTLPCVALATTNQLQLCLSGEPRADQLSCALWADRAAWPADGDGVSRTSSRARRPKSHQAGVLWKTQSPWDVMDKVDDKGEGMFVKSVAWAEKSKRDVASQLVSLALGGVNGQAN